MSSSAQITSAGKVASPALNTVLFLQSHLKSGIWTRRRFCNVIFTSSQRENSHCRVNSRRYTSTFILTFSAVTSPPTPLPFVWAQSAEGAVESKQLVLPREWLWFNRNDSFTYDSHNQGTGGVIYQIHESSFPKSEGAFYNFSYSHTRKLQQIHLKWSPDDTLSDFLMGCRGNQAQLTLVGCW